ncbi:hypothetical protein Nepgr_003150 [Nepenthes gracilis]|uniref:RING-type E3 ubiquitin transferase n=1 Tax=Nepenthes gracilis TaxID=150966 RepID=A0AAD3RYY7_NEPGR|nr:hypothetical protein Nepgr_003150 [Nepenthes gracilis]
MGGNGKFHKWKIFYRPSPSKSDETHRREPPPKEFICPICECLMFDPVVVSSGETFDRLCVRVCRDLNFTPSLSDGSIPDFSTVIPNLAFKSTIVNWCSKSSAAPPQPPDYSSVERIVRGLMSRQGGAEEGKSRIRCTEMELIDAVAEMPDVNLSHAVTELAHRVNHFYSSSSEESVVMTTNPPTPLPLATRPACLSLSSASTSDEILNPNPNSEDEEFVAKFNSHDVYEQEQGVVALRKITRSDEHCRISLCTPRLLSALKPLLISRYVAVQANAVAVLVNLSLEKTNKIKIVRSGIVPPLIDVLKGGFSESQEHAAGALFSLSLEDDNKTVIGVLGALPPLLHSLRSESERTRQDSALALYHLSHILTNRLKLVKLGAIPTLLVMLQSGDLAGRVLLVLWNLANCAEGRSAMLDQNAVEVLVGMLRRNEFDSESIRENCVAALYALGHGSLRFKGLAKEAGAIEVLKEVEKGGSERAREKARRILLMLRGREDGEEGDRDGILELGGLSRTRHRVGGGVGKNATIANSTEF